MLLDKNEWDKQTNIWEDKHKDKHQINRGNQDIKGLISINQVGLGAYTIQEGGIHV